MSLTDGDIFHAYGELHVSRREAKRAYERLRKRSYRHRWPWRTDGGAVHRAYVRGLKDMLNEVSGGGSKL